MVAMVILSDSPEYSTYYGSKAVPLLGELIVGHTTPKRGTLSEITTIIEKRMYSSAVYQRAIGRSLQKSKPLYEYPRSGLIYDR